MSDQPAAPPTAPVPKLMEFIADVSAFRDQVASLDPTTFADLPALVEWVKLQLVENVAELMITQARAVSTDIGGYVSDLAEVVARLQADQDGELLSVESAEILLGALDAGEVVCTIAARIVPKLDQVTATKLQKAITAFRGRGATARALIEEVVDDPDDDQGDEPSVADTQQVADELAASGATVEVSDHQRQRGVVPPGEGG